MFSKGMVVMYRDEIGECRHAKIIREMPGRPGVYKAEDMTGFGQVLLTKEDIVEETAM